MVVLNSTFSGNFKASRNTLSNQIVFLFLLARGGKKRGALCNRCPTDLTILQKTERKNSCSVSIHFDLKSLFFDFNKEREELLLPQKCLSPSPVIA